MVFIIVLLIVKFLILPKRFIEDRITFFAEALGKKPRKIKTPILNSFPSEEQGATINKKEIIKEESADVFYSDINFLYSSGTELYKCNIEKERIVHQSIVYKKSLHKLVGANYIVSHGFDTSDYLFFKLIMNKKWVKTDFVIAAYSPYGVSACLRTYRNKLLINSLFDGKKVVINSFLILIHPIYNKVKFFIRKMLYRKY